MQRWIRIFAPTLALAVVLAAGLSALGGNRASAHQAVPAAAVAQAQPQRPTATEEPTGDPDTDVVEQQDGPQDTADGPEASEAADTGSAAPEADGSANEADEAAALAGKATISEQQARDAALAANPGTTVTKVSLDDENGTVVYSVELSSGADVKVDAQSGKIVSTDQAHGQDGEANDGPDSQSQP